jgi:ABC-type multidrug transport system fused ATPase/permease subunit
VLRNITLTIPARMMIALVGGSGAGKSTMVDLLTLLLKPRVGSIRIDGVPSDAVKLSSWRSQIGYVSQDAVMFDQSVAANISMLNPAATADPEIFERVREAARRANIAGFIEELPEGYGTMIGDRGIRLSGGQRQRLFIARELFKRPSLLILDEATSALDSESERAVQESIDNLHGEITVVIIAHRLSTIRNADRVYVLERGCLIEEGGYEELRQMQGSRFRNMVQLQKV